MDEKGKRRIVSYASARLSEVERRYHVNEQECLALVWSIRRYRPLLEGRHFKVRTDSQVLTWLHRFKETKAKLLRWALILQEYDFEIEHCPGKENQLPDILSRSPADQSIGEVDSCDRLLPPASGEIFAIPDEPLPARIKTAQGTDPLTRQVIQRLQNPNDPRQRLYKSMSIQDGCLWKSATPDHPRKLFVPAGTRRDVLRAFHDQSGHPGRRETERAIASRFYWERMQRTVWRYVKSCQTCAATKAGAHRPAAPLRARTPTAPWHTVSVDLMGPYPRTNTGKTHILVVTDIFSKWVEAFPIGDPKAPTIVRLLQEQVFGRFGYPEVIISDNGSQFVSTRWKRALRRWGAIGHYTGVYHPRANPVERRNQEIKKGLRVRLLDRPHTQWAQHLPAILEDLRSRVNDATGRTPSDALLGYTIPRPGDRNLQDATVPEDRQNREDRLADIRKHQLSYQRRYDGEDVPDPFHEGDPVLIRNHGHSDAKRKIHAGFLPKWLGPYNIRELHSGRLYGVERDGAVVRVPAYDVKPAAAPEEDEDNIDADINYHSSGEESPDEQ